MGINCGYYRNNSSETRISWLRKHHNTANSPKGQTVESNRGMTLNNSYIYYFKIPKKALQY